MVLAELSIGDHDLGVATLDILNARTRHARKRSRRRSAEVTGS